MDGLGCQVRIWRQRSYLFYSMGQSRTHSDFATEQHPDVEVIIVFVQQWHVGRIVPHPNQFERALPEGSRLSITNADYGQSNARGRRGSCEKLTIENMRVDEEGVLVKHKFERAQVVQAPDREVRGQFGSTKRGDNRHTAVRSRRVCPYTSPRAALSSKTTGESTTATA